jgi:hypothetical protein
MTRNTVWDAHEKRFNANLLADRDRLAANDRKPDLFKQLSEHDPYDQLGLHYRKPLFDRISDALGSRDFLLVYTGIWIGCLLTVGCAALWAGVL